MVDLEESLTEIEELRPSELEAIAQLHKDMDVNRNGVLDAHELGEVQQQLYHAEDSEMPALPASLDSHSHVANSEEEAMSVKELQDAWQGNKARAWSKVCIVVCR